MNVEGRRPNQAASHAAFKGLEKRTWVLHISGLRGVPLAVLTMAVAVFIVGARRCDGQRKEKSSFRRVAEEAARYEREFGIVTVCFDGIGNPFVELLPCRDYVTPEDIALGVLFSTDGHDALECTNDQNVRLEQLRVALKARLTRITSRLDDDEEAEETGKRYGATCEAAWRDARRVLLAHQVKRVEQLVVRYFIRQYGWAHALSYGPLGKVLGVTRAQRARIKSIARELHAEIDAEALKSERRAIEELLGAVAVEKRRKVAALLDPPLRRARSAVDVFIFRLEGFSGVAPEGRTAQLLNGKAGNPKGFSRGLSLAVTAPVGATIVMRLSPVSRRSIRVMPLNIAPVTGDFLTRMLMSPVVQEELELVDYQKDFISDKYFESHKLMGTTLGVLTKQVRGDIAVQMVADLQEPIRRKMLETLLPHQRKKLGRIIVQRQIRINGLPQMVAGGYVRGVRVTPRERESMRKVAAKWASTLQRQRAEWEARVEKRLCSVLDSAQREALDRLIGPPLADDSSWLSLTLEQLRHGVCHEAILCEKWYKEAFK